MDTGLSRIDFAMIELGLHRISRLLATTPLPWRAVHVAGTNGKGSICAYISGMLEAYNASAWRRSNSHSALTHARYTSPHLIDRWDCITINQKTVPFSVFHKVEKRVQERNRQEEIGATEFELLTATAFELFTQEEIDVGVVEVGMGGRLDATNVIGQFDGFEVPSDNNESDPRPAPLVAAISSIGLDHQAFLGNTLREIATDKAGIIKQRVPVVYDCSNPSEVVEVLTSWARARGSSTNYAYRVVEPLKIIEKITDVARGHSHLVQNGIVAFQATWMALYRLGRLPLDIRNADGLQHLEELAQSMINVISRTRFPGRQQYLSIERLTGRDEDILLDGAHNAESANALASEVRHLRDLGTRRITWLLAASDSKDVKEILAPLLKSGDSVFAVEFGPVDGMPWVKPMQASRLLQATREIPFSPKSLRLRDCGTDVLAALQAASEEAEGHPMVVAGSLYLVGDVLRLLRDG